MLYNFKISNLHCSACAARIEGAILELPGVQGAAISMENGRLRIEAAEGTLPSIEELSKIANSIEHGTEISPWIEQSIQHSNTHEHEHNHEHDGPSLKIMGICAILLAIGIGLEHFGPEATHTGLLSSFIMLICFVIPYIICGRNVLKTGWQSLLRKDFFNEFTLMSGATIAAIAIGHLEEAVGVMLFYCLGEYFQEKAAGNSRKSIRALLAAKPSIAHLCDENGQNVTETTPENVDIGAYVLVRPGEKIPLDGEVTSGTSYIDTAPLTGEPMPVFAEKGSNIYAGCINKDSVLVVKVTARFADTSVARILEMVENATARKAPTERFITRFARYYTPAVVVAAALVAILPPLFMGASFETWLYRALVLLVISCPCALVISIPLGYFGGIGAASRQGILVKGGYVLDALQHIKVVAFDKTGTLTHGVFSITHVLSTKDSQTELLSMAALAENHSNHPLAKAVVKKCMEELQRLPSALNIEAQEFPGKGMVVFADGTRILAGTKALLEEYNIKNVPSDAQLQQLLPKEAQTGSLVFVSKNNDYLGCLVGSDTLRAESAQALHDIRKEGISKLAMFTGDHEEGARAIARQLPIDIIKSQLLPQDKTTALSNLGPLKESLFMGDGINDAPVLATAGIGVAMGKLGSEAAVETADVVILDDNPARLPTLLRIGKRTRSIVWQNIILALSIKAIFVFLGLIGVSGLWEAVFADVGVAVMAVLNANRTSKI